MESNYAEYMPDVPPSPPSQLDDPRVYLALERTYLAWIRTGLALMGFGFVVARFGLFLQELYAIRLITEPPQGMSARFGTALVLLGVVLTVASLFRYVHLLRRLAQGEKLRRPSRSALALGAALALIGSVVSFYLLVTW